jgi:glucuronate isomerase
MLIHPDRLFPAEPSTRKIAWTLYDDVRALPSSVLTGIRTRHGLRGMMRFREQVTETAGFYNTVGFNDDTRAFLSIPQRHDMARRMDCAFLAKLVTEHRIEEDEALEVAHDLAYRLVRKAYRL